MTEILLLPFKIAFFGIKLLLCLVLFVMFLAFLPFVLLAGGLFLLKCIF